MLMSLSIALHKKISMMILILSPLATIHLFSSVFIVVSTQQVSLQQTEKTSATRNYNDTLGLQSVTTVKSALINTPDMTAGNITSGMATSSSRKKFVDDGRDNVTAGTDISNITHVVATKDNENVTKQLFGMSSNYQRNADEKNFTIVAEPENTEGAVKKIEPGEMPLSPSSSPRAHSKMPSSISSSTLGPEEPPSREIKGVEVQETSTPIEQRKMAGGEGNKLHQTPTEQTKQKNESFRWIFFGVAGFSLMAAIASATLLALTYTGVILAPPRKPTPPNVLPPAVL